MDTALAPGLRPADPMKPRPFRIERVRRELSDTFTMDLTPVDGSECRFAPGQFNMLYVFGIGEVPISISGDPADTTKLVHTTRAVGRVTETISRLKPGAGRSAGPGRSRRHRAATSSSWPAGSVWHRCARRSTR